MTEPNLRERIISVATALFAEKGYSATSIREVVEACSCTKPSLYYYFENKEKLFSDVVNVHIEATNEMIGELGNAEGTTRESIHATLDAFTNWAETNPAAMRLLQRVETQPEEGAPAINIGCARELHLSVMQKLLERGKTSGQIRAELDAYECAIIISGALHFQFELCLANRTFDREQLHRSVDMIFDGIGLAPAVNSQ